MQEGKCHRNVIKKTKYKELYIFFLQFDPKKEKFEALISEHIHSTDIYKHPPPV